MTVCCDGWSFKLVGTPMAAAEPAIGKVALV